MNLKGRYPTSNIEVYLHVSDAVSVAQLDARPTGDQEDAGTTPAGSAAFFRGD